MYPPRHEHSLLAHCNRHTRGIEWRFRGFYEADGKTTIMGIPAILRVSTVLTHRYRCELEMMEPTYHHGRKEVLPKVFDTIGGRCLRRVLRDSIRGARARVIQHRKYLLELKAKAPGYNWVDRGLYTEALVWTKQGEVALIADHENVTARQGLLLSTTKIDSDPLEDVIDYVMGGIRRQRNQLLETWGLQAL